MRTLLVTGGAGFIGGNYVLRSLEQDSDLRIVNLDLLTYAGNLDTLASLRDDDRHVFVHGDIADSRTGAAVAGRVPAGGRRQFRGRKPRGSFHRWSRGVRPDQCRRHAEPAAVHARLVEGTGRRQSGKHSASCMSPPTKSTAAWASTARSPKPRPMRPIRPTRLPRPVRTTWCGPFITPTGCRR